MVGVQLIVPLLLLCHGALCTFKSRKFALHEFAESPYD